MKMRAFLLLIIMIGGTYAMIQSFHDYKEKTMTELFSSTDVPFTTITFTKPTNNGQSSETWQVTNDLEIESLVEFLQNYHIQKLKPREITQIDENDLFSISLKDENGNLISIFVNEELIIENSHTYYEIVDGPLDVNWLVQFFVSNQI